MRRHGGTWNTLTNPATISYDTLYCYHTACKALVLLEFHGTRLGLAVGVGKDITSLIKVTAPLRANK